MPRKRDYIHGFYHNELAKEMDRVLIECDKFGIFLSKKEASAVVAAKSKRGVMTKDEIVSYVRSLKRAFNEKVA